MGALPLPALDLVRINLAAPDGDPRLREAAVLVERAAQARASALRV